MTAEIRVCVWADGKSSACKVGKEERKRTQKKEVGILQQYP